ncbi:1188_t:CDS:2 [Entrophospora sp. SA101]|nr:1188_t:CDS:2 [Entrophospora sp. SA101]
MKPSNFINSSNALNNNNYINNGENNGINDPGISNSNGNGIKEKKNFPLVTYHYHQQFIKIDIRRIETEPTKNQIFLSSVPKLMLLLRFISSELCIVLNATKDEYVIPLDQIKRFKVTQEREIIIELKKNFKKFPRVVSTQDPTFGKFNDIQFLKFLPLDWIDNNTLIFFGEAVRTRHILQKPMNITFDELLTNVRNRYHDKLNLNSIKYKNHINDMITLIDDNDWKAAKWDAKKSKTNTISIFFYNIKY